MIILGALHPFRQVSDATTVCAPGQSSDTCGYNTHLPTVASNTNFIQHVLQLTFGVVGAVALIFIIIAGLRFITAQGDPQGIAKARNSIIYAAIGLIVAIFAEAIVTYVLGVL